MPTPHNAAQKGEIAPVCLMPGDPLRARFIAENFLTGAVCFSEVRGMLGFTGDYKGLRVSVMGHGMGMPSMGIYSHELFSEYGVGAIIRIGSAGALDPDLELGSVVLAQGACTDSRYAAQFELPGDFAPIADFTLLSLAAETARERTLPVRVGNVLSSDVFYSAVPARTEKWGSMGVLCVEMECAALYMNAAFLGKRALGILSISDRIGDPQCSLSAQQRQTSFTDMMELALETALRLPDARG